MSTQTTTSMQPTESMRDTLESIVIAFILAFTFRAYVVEAFVIPTGSMAPTLLGRNVRIDCAQCGYSFKSDPIEQDVKHNRLNRGIVTYCPMCLYGNRRSASTRLRAGDRILVQKYIYSITEPRRWDVVVFKNPLLPSQNFIKRLVGLPNQELAIIEGNVYWKREHAGSDTWKVARKTERPEVQQAVWQMIYDSQFVPRDRGTQGPDREFSWQIPWVPKEQPSQWNFDELPAYRHDGKEPGTLFFDFRRITHPKRNMTSRTHWYPYNQLRELSDYAKEPLEDIRVSVGFQPDTPGLAVRMATTARLRHENPHPSLKSVALRIEPDGRATLEAHDLSSGAGEILRTTMVEPFPPGITRHVSIQHVDQEVSVWIDGKRVDDLLYQYELDIETLKRRQPLTDENQYPHLEITVSNSPVKLHKMQVHRDLYYSSIPKNSRQTGRGTIYKHRSAEGYEGEPVTLQEDQFYCLGDNSPMSQDSRYWRAPDPWIEYLMLNNTDSPEGIVPRKLMMGRAFFVYFPAPLGFGSGAPPLPNFAEMRFIH